LLDPRLANLDQRELGRNEEAVQRDKEERRTESPTDAEEVERMIWVHLPEEYADAPAAQ